MRRVWQTWVVVLIRLIIYPQWKLLTTKWWWFWLSGQFVRDDFSAIAHSVHKVNACLKESFCSFSFHYKSWLIKKTTNKYLFWDRKSVIYFNLLNTFFNLNHIKLAPSYTLLYTHRHYRQVIFHWFLQWKTVQKWLLQLRQFQTWETIHARHIFPIKTEILSMIQNNQKQLQSR